jgi:acyl-CoA thioesterase-2
MPDVPTPQEAPELGALLRQVRGEQATAWLEEWASLELRWIGDSRQGGLPKSDEQPAQVRLWVRTSGKLDDDPVVHQAAFTYLSDLTLLGSALVPHGVDVGSPRVQSASLDHTIWFHRPFRADEWLLYDQASPSASGARGLGIGRVFREDGTLVATVAQEGLIRPRG